MLRIEGDVRNPDPYSSKLAHHLNEIKEVQKEKRKDRSQIGRQKRYFKAIYPPHPPSPNCTCSMSNMYTQAHEVAQAQDTQWIIFAESEIAVCDVN